MGNSFLVGFKHFHTVQLWRSPGLGVPPGCRVGEHSELQVPGTKPQERVQSMFQFKSIVDGAESRLSFLYFLYVQEKFLRLISVTDTHF
jgi:hypothetical protein